MAYANFAKNYEKPTLDASSVVYNSSKGMLGPFILTSSKSKVTNSNSGNTYSYGKIKKIEIDGTMYYEGNFIIDESNGKQYIYIKGITDYKKITIHTEGLINAVMLLGDSGATNYKDGDGVYHSLQANMVGAAEETEDTVTAENTKKLEINFQKVDSENTSKTLAGAEFHIAVYSYTENNNLFESIQNTKIKINDEEKSKDSVGYTEFTTIEGNNKIKIENIGSYNNVAILFSEKTPPTDYAKLPYKLMAKYEYDYEKAEYIYIGSCIVEWNDLQERHENKGVATNEEIELIESTLKIKNKKDEGEKFQLTINKEYEGGETYSPEDGAKFEVSIKTEDGGLTINKYNGCTNVKSGETIDVYPEEGKTTVTVQITETYTPAKYKGLNSSVKAEFTKEEDGKWNCTGIQCAEEDKELVKFSGTTITITNKEDNSEKFLFAIDKIYVGGSGPAEGDGARFKVTITDEKGTFANGTYIYEDLEADTTIKIYPKDGAKTVTLKIEETYTPSEYEGLEEDYAEVTYTKTEDGTWESKIERSPAGLVKKISNTVIRITNKHDPTTKKKSFEFEIEKIYEDGATPVEGAEFTVEVKYGTMEDETKIKKGLKSGEKIKIYPTSNTKTVILAITETKTPAGYKGLTDEVKVTYTKTNGKWEWKSEITKNEEGLAAKKSDTVIQITNKTTTEKTRFAFKMKKIYVDEDGNTVTPEDSAKFIVRIDKKYGGLTIDKWTGYSSFIADEIKTIDVYPEKNKTTVFLTIEETDTPEGFTGLSKLVKVKYTYNRSSKTWKCSLEENPEGLAEINDDGVIIITNKKEEIPPPDKEGDHDDTTTEDHTDTITGIVYLDGFSGVKGVAEPNDKYDNDEPGVEGVIVKLFKNGSVIKTARTNSLGKYTFSGLERGQEYKIEFTYDGVNFEATTPGPGSQAAESTRDNFNSKFQTIELEKSNGVNFLDYYRGNVNNPEYYDRTWILKTIDGGTKEAKEDFQITASTTFKLENKVQYYYYYEKWTKSHSTTDDGEDVCECYISSAGYDWYDSTQTSDRRKMYRWNELYITRHKLLYERWNNTNERERRIMAIS